MHSEEFTALFNTILINVTGFFRDAEAWDYIRAEILPGILEAKAPDGITRVWSAGCASGEEAYTLTMILAEALGVEEFRARQGVRHRRRRGGPQLRPARELRRTAGPNRAGTAAGTLLRSGGRSFFVPQRSAPFSHLRAQ
jgi:hypothetical protein